jgi:electron transport complex protein RnfC
MELKPHQIWHYVTEEEWDGLAQLNPNDCIECGACEYICSSKLPLVSLIKKAKEKVGE